MADLGAEWFPWLQEGYTAPKSGDFTFHCYFANGTYARKRDAARPDELQVDGKKGHLLQAGRKKTEPNITNYFAQCIFAY